MADTTTNEPTLEAREHAKRLVRRANRLMAGWEDESEIVAASELCEQALLHDPTNRQAWIVLGEARIEFEDFQGAAHALGHARALGARSARLWHGLGLAYCELMGHEQQAREAFERLLALRPKDAYALHHFAEALAKAGWKDRSDLLEQSTELLARAVLLEPDDSYHRIHYAAILFRLKRYEEALAAYDELRVRFPRDGTPRQAGDHMCGIFGRAACLGELGQTEEALRILDEELTPIPQHSGWWTFKVELLNRIGRHAEALEAVETSLSLMNEDSWAWEVKAATLHALGFEVEAERAQEQARIVASRRKAFDLADYLYHWTY